ncbi:MAG: DUF1493 family protein [Parafilimonas sp.]|nr:DUF1493 family protein [Parafilimonas sp.]
MEPVLPELKNFIENFCKDNKIKIRIQPIELSTSLDLDLDMFDISMDLFLTKFIERFNIDYSKFNWKNHNGYPKDSTRISLLRLLLGYKNNFSKKIILSFYKPKLFVGDLQIAIKNGYLK